jgi:hypothetical protein
MASTPTLSGFQAFLTGPAGISTTFLPSASQDVSDAFDVAMAIVSTNLACLPGNLYALAVYNLATDNVINYASDQDGQVFFQELRKNYGINLFVPGVTGSSSDSSTSQSRVTPEFMKALTFGDLQNLKTPFGRAYLNIAQMQGTLWGVS